MAPSVPSPWADAAMAGALFAVDPTGIGGVWLRALAGPPRDRWLALLRDLVPPGTPMRRVPLNVSDDRLLGGLDLAATLQAGRPVAQRGILAEADGGIVLLGMAERLSPATGAILSAVLDTGAVALQRDGLSGRTDARIGAVALDEGIEADERPPAALIDRLAFQLDLTALSQRDLEAPEIDAATIAQARQHLAGVTTDDAILQALCAAAMAFGVASPRAPWLALRVARAAAALDGRDSVSTDDAGLAVRLVYVSRATRLPSSEPEAEEPEQDEDEPQPEDPPPPDDEPQENSEDSPSLEDLLVAAVQAAMPDDLLAGLRLAEPSRGAARSAGRAGQAQQSPRFGRPIGTRRGELRAGARLHVIDTLKAAAPWQRLRGRDMQAAATTRIEVRRDDFRIIRFKQRTGTTTIFVVDASGSAALQRLAETKGAVELLLADCYVRRDKVALVAFRGQGAELILPPTNALARARRSLAGLPGGGGTPLASGIDLACTLAESVKRGGQMPILTLMTDGRANIARDGTPGRPLAAQEALQAAQRVRAAGIPSILVDTSPRPNETARALAAEMHAKYVALPYVDAAALTRVVRATTAQLRPDATQSAAAS